jgi:uncharacterized iron-regulated membrane protein
MRARHKLFRVFRRLHLWVGLISALYFMLIAATGVALNHREGWRLDQKYISRTWLPANYRVDDGTEVRSDIVVGDLHSGLLFGRVGAPMLDLVAAVWFFSIVSGLAMLFLRRSIHTGSRNAAIEARIRYLEELEAKHLEDGADKTRAEFHEISRR